MPRRMRACGRRSGLPEAEIRIVDTTQGLAEVHDDVLARFGADVGMVATGAPTGHRREVTSDGEVERFVDEWGVVRARPIGGLYYESTSAPLQGAIDSSDIAAFAWPDPRDPGRFAGMAERARHIRDVERRAVLVGSLCAGVTEMHFRLRGYEDGYMDLAADPGLARQLMERITELKLAYWERVLDEIGDLIDVAAEADDLGAQHAPLFSPQVYRDIVKPLHAELVALIKRRSRARFFLHSCGAISEPHPRSHRDRRGLPQPRPGLGGGHGYGGPEAGVRRRPHLLGRGRRSAACPGARHARRGRRARCAAASAT